VFDEWCTRSADYAGLKLHLTNELGWTMFCPPGSPARTVRNWPVQACGSAILHTAVLLAERRGIEIVAPVHDALMAQCRVEDLHDVSAALDRCMRDASALMLEGYEIPTGDEGGKWLIRPGQRFYDKRGAAMWAAINRLLNTLEAKTA
jgi:DNA polymerase I